MTIAVVAERGEVKVSGTRDTSGAGDDDEDDEDDDADGGNDDHDDDQAGDGGDDETMSRVSAGSKIGAGAPKRRLDPWEKRKAREEDKAKGKGKGAHNYNHNQANRRGPRKYINLKLCSLPSRNLSASSSAGSIQSSGGDAMLQLLLFQADHTIRKEDVDEDTGEKVDRTVYKGGSGGAYEKWCNLNVGSVVAILNPRVLRPLRVSRFSD